MKIKTLGFPKIINFGGDIREFLPSLFTFLTKYKDLEIYMENGYGKGFDLTEEDYIRANPNIIFTNRTEAFQKDLTVILKMPDLEELEQLIDGNGIFTMCHYHTRPKNVELFQKKKIKTFSMDSIVDDHGKRIFVDYFSTALNGAVLAVRELKKTMVDFFTLKERPLVISIIGIGGLGQNCGKAFEYIFTNERLHYELPELAIKYITRGITGDEEKLIETLKESDILVDASKRKDTTSYIIRNELVAYLPKHAIVLDLSADRYEDYRVKPIEGTVVGSLSKMVIYPEDPLYETLPQWVDSRNRRVNVSCNAWPGANPKQSILYYEWLIKDYLDIFSKKDLDDIEIDSENPLERALSRSILKNYLELI